MHPVIAEFGGLTIGSHEFFVGLGVLLAAIVVVTEARRRGMWGDGMLVAVAGGLAGGAIGMHATSWLRSPRIALHAAPETVWLYGAKSVLGGLTGAYLGVLVGKRLIGYRPPTGDVFAPAVALGMAVGRIGCLLTEPPGRPTDLPWAIHLSPEQIAAIPGCDGCTPGVGMHPSFGYEIAFHLIAFATLLRLRHRPTVPGLLFAGYLAAYAAFRFGVEFTRPNEVVLAGLTRGQWFIAALGPLLARRLWLLRRATSSRHSPLPEGQPA
jgi:phosphatidylglycerol---prolipoprotein diacylglyceryl transferase